MNDLGAGARSQIRAYLDELVRQVEAEVGDAIAAELEVGVYTRLTHGRRDALVYDFEERIVDTVEREP